MAGNKNSGRHGIPPGPGRIPTKFTLKMGDKFGMFEQTPADGQALPVFATVVEVGRSRLVLETGESRIVIFR